MNTSSEESKTPEKPRKNMRKVSAALALTATLAAGSIAGAIRTSGGNKKSTPVEEAVINLTEKYKDYPTSIVIRGEDGEIIEKIDGKGLLINVTPVNFPDVKGLPTHTEVAEMRTDQDYPHFVEDTTQYLYKIADGDFRYFEVPIYGTSTQTPDGGTQYNGSPFELCERDLSFCAGFGLAKLSEDSPDTVNTLAYNDANREFAIHLIQSDH